MPTVYAVDLPSGINGTTGAMMGIAVRAAHTVTFFRKKLGHVLMPGRSFCGAITVADIGIAVSVLAKLQPHIWLNGPELWSGEFPTPDVLGHKYSRGHAVVVSGGFSFTGAARLAARGALRAGAGLVTIASPRSALAVNAGSSLAVMVRAVDGAGELADFLSDSRRNVVVLGPGGGVGPEMRELVSAALAGKRSAVLDADALTSFAGGLNALIDAIKRGPASAILTPHEGEFSRLFSSVEEISNAPSKLERARQAAALSGAVCLLKGPDTVIAAPDGRCAINAHAPASLATAGSGDVLAGIIAGLLAQGMPCFEAACAGVWLHGQAASRGGPGLISEDLPEILPRLYAQIERM
jgi:ADP-dependent NAD(P)H-hydrate dehydratase / NAD(P)H-hydrate epimerase